MSKLLLIGIDALDAKTVSRLIKKELLPNFAKLRFKFLQTTIPPETPVAWSAAATGCNPGEYNIYDFINRDPSSYQPKLNLATQKQGIIKNQYKSALLGVPFWEILTNNQVPITLIRWPVTFPATKIKGRMLSGLGTVDLKGTLNSYTFYTDSDLPRNPDAAKKTKIVSWNDDTAESVVEGPIVKKRGSFQPITVPISFYKQKDGLILKANNQSYNLKEEEWSSFIRLEFKPLRFLSFYGICNAYLISLNPFRLYLSSVQIDPVKQALPLTYPSEYGKELADNIGLFHTLGMPEETKALTEDVLPRKAFLEQIEQITTERTKMLLYELERFKEGVLAFAFDAGDRLQHIFWKEQNNDSEIPEEIIGYYKKKDELLGSILEKTEDDTKIIVFSDHGFSHFKTQCNLNNLLYEAGLLCIKKEISFNELLEGDENRLLQFVDWTKTKAYSLGFTSIYINLEGRESQGIVSKDDYGSLIQKIQQLLSELEYDGKKVITNVYLGKKIYRGEHASNSPDIVVGFSLGFRISWESAVGALQKEVITPNTSKWQGDHLIDRSHVPGVLFTNFPVKKPEPSITDIAPTILSFYNINAPENLEGEPLH